MNNTESYLEKCIQRLPAEKQAAARAAVRDIAETGDDSLIAKLLLVFEANAAYAERIPEQMVRFGESFLRDLDARSERAAQDQKKRDVDQDGRLAAIISAQVPQLGKTLAHDKLVSELKAQTAEIGRLERSVARMRRARVGGLLLILLLGATLGAGGLAGIYWQRYAAGERARRFTDRLSTAGIAAEATYEGNNLHLQLEVPTALRGTAWKKNDAGYIAGVDLIVPAEATR